MATIEIRYEGDLRAIATHVASGAVLSTDAPKDNEGLGASFSPTDLLATSLGTCMLTIMGIVARRRALDLRGVRVEVQKIMVADPDRRVGRLEVAFWMPAGLDPATRKLLEASAFTCPVKKSLSERVETPVRFHYPD